MDPRKLLALIVVVGIAGAGGAGAEVTALAKSGTGPIIEDGDPISPSGVIENSDPISMSEIIDTADPVGGTTHSVRHFLFSRRATNPGTGWDAIQIEIFVDVDAVRGAPHTKKADSSRSVTGPRRSEVPGRR